MTDIIKKKTANRPPPPPLGNKRAVGSKGGGQKKYDLEKEAAELLEWSLKEDSLRLYGFTFYKDYPTQKLEEYAKRSPVFRNALTLAKNRLAMRREQYASMDKMGIPAHVYNKTAHIYDTELVESSEYISEKALDKALKRRLKEIEHGVNVKAAMDAKNQISPNIDNINSDNENMLLKAQLALALKQIEDLKANVNES